MQPRKQSSVQAELGFLLFFVILFFVALTGMNRLLLPHHYSKLAVLMLTSIIVGILTIAARSAIFGRSARA